MRRPPRHRAGTWLRSSQAKAFHSRGALRARVVLTMDPPQTRGAGKTRHRPVPVAPVREDMHGAGTTGSAGNPGPPCAIGYGLYVLSSVHRAFWPPYQRRRMRVALKTPASGCQDHTTSPSATNRSSALPKGLQRSVAAIAPRLACRDDRDTPSARGGLGPADIKFRKNERRMFPCCRLDSSHGLEPECKIRVLPHAPFVLETAEQTRGSASDGPTGDSLARQVPKRVVRRPRRRAWVVSRRQGWRETCSD
jgi:hypothetical protein